jgi:KipI family sensor histidine kinase inhibitor
MSGAESCSVPFRARYLAAGDCAIVIEYGSVVDPAINDHVLALDAAVAKAAIEGVIEATPTLRSLMVHFDPLQISQAELIRRLQAIEVTPAASTVVSRSRWLLPICYEGDCAEDLVEVAEKLGMPPEQVVSLHSSAVYRIYMYGFAPGYLYLGGNPPELYVSRRAAPRPAPVAVGGIVMAVGCTGIYPCPLPTGWYVIGRTPERLFVLDRSPIFLGQAGDEIVFDRIDRNTFDVLSKEAAAGRTLIRRVG